MGRPARLITAHGITRPLTEWARALNVDHSTIRHRLAAGWPPEDAVTVPPDTRTRHPRLSLADKDLIADCKAERARLAGERERIEREISELSDRALAAKFGVSIDAVRNV